MKRQISFGGDAEFFCGPPGPCLRNGLQTRQVGLEKAFKTIGNHYKVGGTSSVTWLPHPCASRRGVYVSVSSSLAATLQNIVLNQQVSVVWVWPSEAGDVLLRALCTLLTYPKDVKSY